MYHVYNHWDKLKVCVVGRSYPPEFYNFIKNTRLRSLFERIAIETEEDFQGLIKKLHEFGVETVRPNVPNIIPEKYITNNIRIPGPVSMNPRDQMIVIGNKFFLLPYEYNILNSSGRMKLREFDTDISQFSLDTKNLVDWWSPILEKLQSGGISIYDTTNESDSYYNILKYIKSAGITRIGKDLYFGTESKIFANIMQSSKIFVKKYISKDYRCHFIDTQGHSDGCFTPVKPGLIVSAYDMAGYEKTFPDWEIVKVKHRNLVYEDWWPLKKKNKGKWWLPNSSNDNELVEFVETWLRDWVGQVSETNFDVNCLVVDQNNILVTAYNKEVFDAYQKHGVTPHIVPLRHREFWDGGLSCLTAELYREGEMQDWFPNRELHESIVIK